MRWGNATDGAAACRRPGRRFGTRPWEDPSVILREDVLHLTNGDSTIEIMRRARIGGDTVPWRDVLHEGPVPALAPAELRPVRARYLARLGFPEAGQLEAELCARDERLGAALEAGEPVVL